MSESRLCLLYRVSEFTSVNVSWVARDNVPCRESEGRALGRVWDRVPAGCRGRAHAGALFSGKHIVYGADECFY